MSVKTKAAAVQPLRTRPRAVLKGAIPESSLAHAVGRAFTAPAESAPRQSAPEPTGILQSFATRLEGVNDYLRLRVYSVQSLADRIHGAGPGQGTGALEGEPVGEANIVSELIGRLEQTVVDLEVEISRLHRL